MIKPIDKIIQPVIEENMINKISKNKTGIQMTATQIGYDLGLSAQEVNKGLKHFGLLDNNASGNVLTEIEKQFGQIKEKMTVSGHWFSNIEWDSSVKDLLMSPENQQKILDIRNMKISDDEFLKLHPEGWIVDKNWK